MFPSQFVAIFGTSPETDWPALTGRDDNGVGRESRKKDRIWFWNLLFLRKTATTIKQTLDRKEDFDEKTSGNTGSSSGSSSCRTQHSQLEKIVKQNMIIK